MAEKIVKNNSIRREVVIHREEILDMLKSAVADKAGDFLGLNDWKMQDNPDNVFCLDEHQLIIPTEGLHFTSVDNPVEAPKK